MSSANPLSLALRFEIKLAKAQAVLEFMEPVYVDMSLKNIGKQSISVDKSILDDLTHMAI